jgi:hypothetical protein
MGNITDLLMMSRANISYSTESFPGPAKPQSVQAALTSAATSAGQKFECACSIVLATHGKKAAWRDASLQRPTGHYGQTASSSTWSLTRQGPQLFMIQGFLHSNEKKLVKLCNPLPTSN